jgi:hypothetical protein
MVLKHLVGHLSPYLYWKVSPHAGWNMSSEG